jgi:hypothetical protein
MDEQSRPERLSRRLWNRRICTVAGLWLAGPSASDLFAQKAKERRAQKAAEREAAPKVASKPAEPPAPLGEPLKDHPLLPVLVRLREARATARELKDYKCLFVKREVLQGRLASQTLDMKFRTEPVSVYFKFLDPSAGREVLYVAGRNKGKLLVHESGIRAFAGTFEFVPNDPTVMAENRYPITQAGMASMADSLVLQWDAETRFPAGKVVVDESSRLGDVPCIAIESSHPAPQSHVKFHKTLLYIDKQRNLPVRVEQFAFPGKGGGAAPLIEEYTYFKIQTNVGLSDIDFDRTNKAYAF